MKEYKVNEIAVIIALTLFIGISMGFIFGRI